MTKWDAYWKNWDDKMGIEDQIFGFCGHSLHIFVIFSGRKWGSAFDIDSSIVLIIDHYFFLFKNFFYFRVQNCIILDANPDFQPASWTAKYWNFNMIFIGLNRNLDRFLHFLVYIKILNLKLRKFWLYIFEEKEISYY